MVQLDGADLGYGMPTFSSLKFYTPTLPIARPGNPLRAGIFFENTYGT